MSHCFWTRIRLPRRILYSELQHGQRAAGGQKKRFSDHIKASLRKCSVPPDQLEVLAADRDTWRDVCEEGLAAFDISYNHRRQKSVTPGDTRLQVFLHPDHAATSVAEPVHLTSVCGVIFNLTAHRLLPVPANTASSSSATDIIKQASKNTHYFAEIENVVFFH